jgi:hypothetical protein
MIKGFFTTDTKGNDAFTFSSLSITEFAILAENAGHALLTIKAVSSLDTVENLPSLFR